jgi:hypothetical protein
MQRYSYFEYDTPSFLIHSDSIEFNSIMQLDGVAMPQHVNYAFVLIALVLHYEYMHCIQCIVLYFIELNYIELYCSPKICTYYLTLE